MMTLRWGGGGEGVEGRVGGGGGCYAREDMRSSLTRACFDGNGDVVVASLLAGGWGVTRDEACEVETGKDTNNGVGVEHPNPSFAVLAKLGSLCLKPTHEAVATAAAAAAAAAAATAGIIAELVRGGISPYVYTPSWVLVTMLPYSTLVVLP